MLTRRSLIAATPWAVAASPLSPVRSAGSSREESQLRSLWRRHQAVRAAFNASVDDTPEHHALFDELLLIEEEASTVRPQTLEDLAWLVIFADDDGLFVDGNFYCSAPLMEFCREITGVLSSLSTA